MHKWLTKKVVEHFNPRILSFMNYMIFKAKLSFETNYILKIKFLQGKSAFPEFQWTCSRGPENRGPHGPLEQDRWNATKSDLARIFKSKFVLRQGENLLLTINFSTMNFSTMNSSTMNFSTINFSTMNSGVEKSRIETVLQLQP